MTLVEVLIALVLISAAAGVVYQSIFYSYKTMMRSRARLDAQGIALDRLWELFNSIAFDDLPNTAQLGSEPTPEGSVFSTNGIVEYAILPETDVPVSWIEYWEITVQVWAPTNSALFSLIATNGTVISGHPEPLAAYTVFRYRGDRSNDD